MKFIAYRNIIDNSDSLYIEFSIIKNAAELTDLVRNWIEDRGCHDSLLLMKVRNTLKELYDNKTTYGENNVDLFKVEMHKEEFHHRYKIVFWYKTIGELTYKAVEDGNKNK